ncbi:hypothetical protein ACFL0H_02720 [Thermodesulfobacteriota bacterium]
MNAPEYAVMALGAIRKKALLLSIANEYFCENQYLIKMGNDIDKNIEKLKEDISSLKNEFPGKFKSEIETDPILEKIRGTAHTMLKPGKDVKESCSSGELGRKLESDVKSIANAIDLIRVQVYGSASGYTRKDSVSGLFGRFSGIGQSMGNAVILGVKLLCGLIVIAILAFLFFFITMEKEGGLLKDIAGSRDYIQTQKELVTQLNLKKEEISKEIKSLEKGDMVRGEKIVILDLEADIHKINQDLHKAEAEVAAHEKNITDNQERIEDLKKVPFMKRLLRR